MRSEDAARLQSIFASALELPEAERTAYLERECTENADLRRELQAMLAADARMDGLTARLLGGVVTELLQVSAAQTSLTGTRIGVFELREELGRGGMGSVYRAERVDGTVSQQVAIKFVRCEVLDANTIWRFKLERQLMASFDHPNIARLIDAAELHDGTPYFVMEYVAGVPISEYCEHAQLTRRERVALMRKVCAAVAEAHRKLIVHRDLKPTNILVTASGSPKLLDFGIAKPLEHVSAHGEQTGTGQRFFSPLYAAPEQLTGAPTGVACDIYALGLLLYELLAGTRPFDFTGLSAGQVERLITKVPPIQPSVAAARSSDRDNAMHARQLRGDLDGIVLRCLRKSANERYASVEQLEADLGNYLEGRPVQARGGHRWYRAQKFVRRNLAAVSATVFMAVTLVAALLAFAWQARIAEQQRDRAEAQSARAVATSRFLEDLIAAPDPWKLQGATPDSRNVRVVDALTAAGATLDQRLADNPALRGEIATMLGRTLRRLGQLEASRKQLDAALRDLNPGTAQSSQLRIAAELELALTAAEQGEYQTAHEVFERLLPQIERNHDIAFETIFEIRNTAAEVLGLLGDGDHAEKMARETLARAIAAEGDGSAAASAAKAALGSLLSERGAWNEADTLISQAYATELRRLGTMHPAVISLMSNSAASAFRARDFALAEQRYREVAKAYEQVLGSDHPATLSAQSNLATALANLGQNEAAIAMFEPLIQKRSKALGANHSDVLLARANHAVALRELGRFEEAEFELVDVYNRRRRTLGETHPETLKTLGLLGVFARDRKDWVVAEQLLRQAAGDYETSMRPEHPESLAARNNHLSVLRELGRAEEAVAAYPDLIRIAATVYPDSHVLLASMRGHYGASLLQLNQFERAEPVLLASYRALRDLYGSDDPRLDNARERIEKLYAQWGKPERGARKDGG